MPNFKFIAESIRKDTEAALSKSGLFFRVFARGKEEASLRQKISKDPNKYAIGGKLIQDAIGIRVVLYFEEDVALATNILNSKYRIDPHDSTIDNHDTDTFNVKRHNLIADIPDHHSADFEREVVGLPIDSTFEIQLRSILSEGWHEIDHDLRYKSKSTWTSQDDLSRIFNGISATLETAEWSMKRVFEELAYRHYKSKNWNSMVECKFRMRTNEKLSDGVFNCLNCNPEIAKELYRSNRNKIVSLFSQASPSIPTNLDNIVHIWNLAGPGFPDLKSIAPTLLIEQFS